MSTHDWGYGESDIEAGAREENARDSDLREWESELLADRLYRNDPVRSRCCLCHEGLAVSVYGWKCKGCFDAQREARGNP